MTSLYVLTLALLITIIASITSSSIAQSNHISSHDIVNTVERPVTFEVGQIATLTKSSALGSLWEANFTPTTSPSSHENSTVTTPPPVSLRILHVNGSSYYEHGLVHGEFFADELYSLLTLEMPLFFQFGNLGKLSMNQYFPESINQILENASGSDIPLAVYTAMDWILEKQRPYITARDVDFDAELKGIGVGVCNVMIANGKSCDPVTIAKLAGYFNVFPEFVRMGCSLSASWGKANFIPTVETQTPPTITSKQTMLHMTSVLAKMRQTIAENNAKAEAVTTTTTPTVTLKDSPENGGGLRTIQTRFLDFGFGPFVNHQLIIVRHFDTFPTQQDTSGVPIVYNNFISIAFCGFINVISSISTHLTQSEKVFLLPNGPLNSQRYFDQDTLSVLYKEYVPADFTPVYERISQHFTSTDPKVLSAGLEYYTKQQYAGSMQQFSSLKSHFYIRQFERLSIEIQPTIAQVISNVLTNHSNNTTQLISASDDHHFVAELAHQVATASCSEHRSSIIETAFRDISPQQHIVSLPAMIQSHLSDAFVQLMMQLWPGKSRHQVAIEHAKNEHTVLTDEIHFPGTFDGIGDVYALRIVIERSTSFLHALTFIDNFEATWPVWLVLSGPMQSTSNADESPYCTLLNNNGEYSCNVLIQYLPFARVKLTDQTVPRFLQCGPTMSYAFGLSRRPQPECSQTTFQSSMQTAYGDMTPAFWMNLAKETRSGDVHAIVYDWNQEQFWVAFGVPNTDHTGYADGGLAYQQPWGRMNWRNLLEQQQF